jgi:hypothetical protein
VYQFEFWRPLARAFNLQSIAYRYGMRNRSSNPKRPRDPNQLAKLVVDRGTGNGEPAPEPVEPDKDPAAVALGRKGGLKGGPARAKKLTAEQRSESAKKAAKARWAKKAWDPLTIDTGWDHDHI